ncbi:hypothetical protein MXD61_07205, partial [Frankia sp. AgPm24]|nr:hypothetical protein [Frankia sp. AgPm24]
AREVLGWQPRVAFEELVAMMVDNDLALESEAATHDGLLTTSVAAPRRASSPAPRPGPPPAPRPGPLPGPRPSPPSPATLPSPATSAGAATSAGGASA